MLNGEWRILTEEHNFRDWQKPIFVKSGPVTTGPSGIRRFIEHDVVSICVFYSGNFIEDNSGTEHPSVDLIRAEKCVNELGIPCGDPYPEHKSLPEKPQSVEQIESACTEAPTTTYTELYRNSESNEGKVFKFTGMVEEQEGGRISNSAWEISTGFYWYDSDDYNGNQTIRVVSDQFTHSSGGVSVLLEDDIVEFCGMSIGLHRPGQSYSEEPMVLMLDLISKNQEKDI